MKRLRSGWCETGFCSRCPELLQVASDRRREIHCDCACHHSSEADVYTRMALKSAQARRKRKA